MGRVRRGLRALTENAGLASSDVLREHAQALWEVTRCLGDPRNVDLGTIGGVCAYEGRASDYPAVMPALDATFSLAGRR